MVGGALISRVQSEHEVEVARAVALASEGVAQVALPPRLCTSENGGEGELTPGGSGSVSTTGLWGWKPVYLCVGIVFNRSLLYNISHHLQLHPGPRRIQLQQSLLVAEPPEAAQLRERVC